MLNPFVKEKLEYILDHAETIQQYFSGIRQPGDFTAEGEGQKSLDAIITRLTPAT